MADTNLHEIIFAARGYGREGFSVELTADQMSEVKGRLQAGEHSGVVRDWQTFNPKEDAISYEQLVATLERGEYVRGAFPAPDDSADVYLVQATYKPKFFGLRKEREVSPNVLMTSGQAKHIEETLSNDDRLSDYQVVDMGANISTEEFFKLLEERGV